MKSSLLFTSVLAILLFMSFRQVALASYYETETSLHNSNDDSELIDRYGGTGYNNTYHWDANRDSANSRNWGEE